MGWFSNLFARTKDLVNKDAEHLVYVRIPGERVSPTHGDAPIEANAHYIRLWLTGMFLAERTEWFKSYAPVVHSVVRLRFGVDNTPGVELPHVAGQAQLDGVEAGNLDRIIHLDYPLTGLLPFRGGTVELAAGLVRARQRALLASMISVLGELSKLTTVPQLSGAIAVLRPLAEGLGSVLSSPDDELWLGMSDTFVGAGGEAADNTLRPGYLAIVNASRQDLDPSQLCVRDRRLCLGPDVATAPELTGHDFMLFRVESRSHREKDEWELLSTIDQPWRAALGHLRSGDMERAIESMGAAIYAVQTSADLTSDDRDAVIRRLKERFKLARAQYDLSDLAAFSTGPTKASAGFSVPATEWSLGEIMTGPAPTLSVSPGGD